MTGGDAGENPIARLVSIAYRCLVVEKGQCLAHTLLSLHRKLGENNLVVGEEAKYGHDEHDVESE